MSTARENESLKSLKERIDGDLGILETSNLSQVNHEKYEEFKTKYSNLNQKLLNYQTVSNPEGLTLEPITIFSLNAEFAQISSEFENFMKYQGNRNIVANQIDTIKHNLESIIAKLRRSNYKEIKKELDYTIEMYSNILNNVIGLQEIDELIKRFNYQVYKYKIEDLICDDSTNITLFIPYVLEDINRILNDSQVSTCIKDKLQVYLFNTDLIKSNFNKVIILINIGIDKKQIDEKDLNNELNRNIYKESDLEKVYHPLSNDTIKRMETILFSLSTRLKIKLDTLFYRRSNVACSEHDVYYKQIFKCFKGDLLKEIIAELCYGKFYQFCIKHNDIDLLNRTIDDLIYNNFLDFRYLAESIFGNNIPNPISEILRLRAALKNYGKDYSYDIDCVVFAHVKEINPQDLVDYIIATESELLRRYVLKSGNEEYLNSDFNNYNLKKPTIIYGIRIINEKKQAKAVKLNILENKYLNYDQFIQMLHSLNSTDEILLAIFEYFKKYVSYNYDELQVVKFQRGESELFENIRELLFQNKTNSTEEFKGNLLKLLDEAFLKIEGRPLSDKNRHEWFKNYGTIIHHEAQPEVNGIFKIAAREAYDEIVHIEPNNYPPIYENKLLVEGVCSEYSNWIKQICDELGIPCLKVRGKGTTGHVWNLIYIKERDMWVNFDMTMVRFYLDNWTRDYGEPEKWIFPTFEEMFEMQPIRVVEEIISDNDNIRFNPAITVENQTRLNEFLYSSQLIGKSKK